MPSCFMLLTHWIRRRRSRRLNSGEQQSNQDGDDRDDDQELDQREAADTTPCHGDTSANWGKCRQPSDRPDSIRPDFGNVLRATNRPRRLPRRTNQLAWNRRVWIAELNGDGCHSTEISVGSQELSAFSFFFSVSVQHQRMHDWWTCHPPDCWGSRFSEALARASRDRTLGAADPSCPFGVRDRLLQETTFDAIAPGTVRPASLHRRGPSDAVAGRPEPGEWPGDILTRGWENWTVEGPSPSRTFGALTVTLKAPTPLEVRWYKPLLVHGDPDIRRRRRDRLPGRHPRRPDARQTFLGRLSQPCDRRSPGSYDILVDGRPTSTRIQPTTKVHHDQDAACSYVGFTAADAPVVITFKSPGHEVIVNWFRDRHRGSQPQSDQAVPLTTTSTPTPIPARWSLGWTTRNFKVDSTYDVYLGNHREAVAAAGRSAPEFRGNRREATYRAEASPTTATASGVSTWSTRPRASPKATSGISGQGTWRSRAPEGYGRFAQGGRGGKVIEVTNLNDAGPGSFRRRSRVEGPHGRLPGFQSDPTRLADHDHLALSHRRGPDRSGRRDLLPRPYAGHLGRLRDIIFRFLRVRPGDEAGRSLDGIGLGESSTP